MSSAEAVVLTSGATGGMEQFGGHTAVQVPYLKRLLGKASRAKITTVRTPAARYCVEAGV